MKIIDTPMKMGVPNEIVRIFLEKDMVNYIVDSVEPVLLDDYKNFIYELEFEFEKACRVSEEIVSKQKEAPPNEVKFAALAI